MKTLLLLISTLSVAVLVLTTSANVHGTAPLPPSVETIVCRTVPADNPIDLNRDTKLCEARDVVGDLFSSGVTPSAAEIESALSQHFAQVTSYSDGMYYVWVQDEDEEWFELCIEKTTFEVDAHTDSNPILVEFTMSE